jgi:16S rRNA (cytidine1402-2'-O)-methyltransferase|tara:strand:- start:730 stop:1431 length:702 start_codon:yes stop_codon:yes gene_type:complete
MEYGSLYLIPNYLGKNSHNSFGLDILKIIKGINYFIFENEKPGRAFIKSVCPEKNQSKLIINTLNKFTQEESIKSFLDPCLKGLNMGLISDAGCPGIADPGANIVSIAHELKIKIVPLVGPSSILLALMASGFNGQSFKFNGYLAIDKNVRKEQIKLLEKKSQNTTQIFMETPYRNDNLVSDLTKILKASTRLCIASDITLESELIKTETIQNWRNNKVKYNKRPSIFIIQAT